MATFIFVKNLGTNSRTCVNMDLVEQFHYGDGGKGSVICFVDNDPQGTVPTMRVAESCEMIMHAIQEANSNYGYGR